MLFWCCFGTVFILKLLKMMHLAGVAGFRDELTTEVDELFQEYIENNATRDPFGNLEVGASVLLGVWCLVLASCLARRLAASYLLRVTCYVLLATCYFSSQLVINRLLIRKLLRSVLRASDRCRRELVRFSIKNDGFL